MMKRLIMDDLYCGSDISAVFDKAQDISRKMGVCVMFNFNGVEVNVNDVSNKKLVMKLYHCCLVDRKIIKISDGIY